MKLTQQDMARILGVATSTLRKWKIERPKLYEQIIKGFAFDELVEQSKKSYDEVKALQEKYQN